MTNLQKRGTSGEGDLTPALMRRLWLWGPIAVGGALATLLLGSVAVPTFQAISVDQQRLRELEQKEQEAALLRLQKQKVEKERLDAERQKEVLVRLLSGQGDGTTFLATLDLEARQTGVKLQLFEPSLPPVTPGQPPGGNGKAGAPPAPGSPPPAGAPGAPGADGKAPPGPPPDPLEQAGLRPRRLLVSARGTYPQLLAFLRRMELLDQLVEQKDLNLVTTGAEPGRPATTDRDLPPQVPEVEVKLQMTLYNKLVSPKDAAPKDTPAPAPKG